MRQKKKLIGLGLVSGGLDSLIACKLMQMQNINVIGLNFTSPFCLCNKIYSNSECGLNVFYTKLGLKIYSLPKEDDYLDIIRQPKFGYGKNLNPCIDCRIYILKKAKIFAKQVKADFLFTGEVLNQRPKSQTLKALNIVEKEAELEGKLLRPLSAKLLKPTEWEQQGLIDRDRLEGINGRSRKVQLELARKYGLLENYYACGGCLLTDKNFSRRMRDFLHHNQDLLMDDVSILKYGRHFRYNGLKIIVGRNEAENKILSQLKNYDDIIMEAMDVNGPTTVVKSTDNIDVLKFAAELTLRYSDLIENEGNISFRRKKTDPPNILVVKRREDLYFKAHAI
ncbi:MAG: hypothetical protein ACFFBP_16420 [Promethearchaeota archaeon]